jgi:hypothetical protein
MIALSLAGCTTAVPSTGESSASEEIVPPPVVAVGTHSSGEPFYAALVQGDLGLTDRGCFGLEAPTGKVLPVVFQKGTTVLPELDGISVPGYGDIALGDRVSGSGGFFATQGLGDLDIPAVCREDDVAAILLS